VEGKHKIHEETQDALKATNTDMWKVPYFKYIREVKIPRFRCTGTSSDVSSCFTDVCNSIIPVFCFLAIDNDIMRKMCTLITSKGTDIDENIANQNHATRHVHRNRGILTSLILAS
jgi:hypothetical protein